MQAAAQAAQRTRAHCSCGARPVCRQPWLALTPPRQPPRPAGYVRLVNFSQHAPVDMSKAIYQLKVCSMQVLAGPADCSTAARPSRWTFANNTRPAMNSGRLTACTAPPACSAMAPRPSSWTCATTRAAWSAAPWRLQGCGSTAPPPCSTWRCGGVFVWAAVRGAAALETNIRLERRMHRLRPCLCIHSCRSRC